MSVIWKGSLISTSDNDHKSYKLIAKSANVEHLKQLGVAHNTEFGQSGGDRRNRTDDLITASDTLSQLSYVPKYKN